ncbi:MAG: glutamate-5-semialdehyde dehydrogenase [Lachnospiraceae bacterium]|nr:glutamate-5-semialdehyde dehydrogenase [Lachnospiraceae bacterium]
MDVKKAAMMMKADAPKMAAMSGEARNAILAKVCEALKASRDEIFAANAADMEAAKKNGIAEAVMKRLKFDDHKMEDCVSGITQLIGLPDPLGRKLLERELDEGLVLSRVSCPIGVIGIIFEARPDALIQISALCIKSGNCALLKGGKETANTNRVLFNVIKKAALEGGAPEGCLFQAEAHSEIDELLKCEGYVDLIIPRGSNAFVRYIMDNTKIPVMGHSDGVCHTYVDKEADIEKAIPIIIDAKTQYSAACNATETLLVDRRIAKIALPAIAKALTDAGVKLRANAETSQLIDAELMGDDEYNTEYLAWTLSVKIVDGVDEAIEHINRFGSHHTDCIITENDATATHFMQLVDSAGVYQNCSTRFADGFRYGFGAEVGISTSKLHARGPVGLEGLTTYKYLLRGNGQIVGDYASGKKQFHHRDL